MDGEITFNKDKFKNLIHYIIDNGNSNEISELSLVKIAYFSDFNFYGLKDVSISGEIYIRKENGPVASHFEEIIVELANERKIDLKIEDYGIGNPVTTFISLTAPDISVFSSDEINVINESIILEDLESRLTDDEDLNLHSSVGVFEDTYGDMMWEDTATDDIIYYYPEPDDEQYKEYVANTHKAIKQVEDGDCESMSPEEFLEELDSL